MTYACSYAQVLKIGCVLLADVAVPSPKMLLAETQEKVGGPIEMVRE
jgi:hypothetical protein